MSLKGQYVRTLNGSIGMIDSEDPDPDGYVSVYFGTADKTPFRNVMHIDAMEPIDPPKNCRINGEIPAAEFEPPPPVLPAS